jgi:hypothetical protein
MSTQNLGSILWIDLTVPDADRISDFYSGVVGWSPVPVDMKGYNDYNMTSPDTGDPCAGICHARGPNAGLPAQWLIYITVGNMEKSLAQCRKLGGEVLVGPKGMGNQGKYAVIRDPAGAVAALFEPAGKESSS